ncbi:unnamed protein product [Clonostachys rhizophaga]|uniref:Uncharacterized protein n=1 Tax=Clonostachys rhizophaga TaxID=160324 RepID=A0A9N9VPS5_9HYPO|nr:unnamed protein product [Clonostachys rhizophaga]
MRNLSPQGPTAPKGFFGLPAKVHQRIYESVLILAHPIYLFHGQGSQVEVFAPEKPRKWLALFQTCRQMHKEASAVLYGSNIFNLVDTTEKQPDLLHSFLTSIESLNSGALKHLCIQFPGVENTQDRARRCKLAEESPRSLSLPQQECIRLNLKTLEVFLDNLKTSDLAQLIENDPTLATEALSQIDAQLNAISSLVHIIVRVYDKNLNPSLELSMKELGWTVLRGD